MGDRPLLRATTAMAVAILVIGGATAAGGSLPGPPAADDRPCLAVAAPTPPEGTVAPPAAAPAPAPAPPEAAPGSTQQQIGVTILGGELSVPEPLVAVDLVPAPGRTGVLVGTLPPVTVVDARGTHAGWQLGWSVAHLTVEGGTVTLDPGPVQVVHGLPGGLDRGGICQGGGLLARSAPDAGGGTHEVGATVTVALPPGATATEARVDLAFTAS